MGDQQRLKGGAAHIGDGTQAGMLALRLLQERDDLRTAGGAQDQARVGIGQQLFAIALGHAAAHDDIGGGIEPARAAHGLQAFLIARAGDGAGIDDIHIAGLVEIAGLVAGLLKQLQHGLAIVLVHLTAQGMEGNGFHWKKLLLRRDGRGEGVTRRIRYFLESRKYQKTCV